MDVARRNSAAAPRFILAREFDQGLAKAGGPGAAFLTAVADAREEHALFRGAAAAPAKMIAIELTPAGPL
ncbi:MAG: hypothetical protein WA840_21000 [Caulobacteraceae bacterium]